MFKYVLATLLAVAAACGAITACLLAGQGSSGWTVALGLTVGFGVLYAGFRTAWKRENK